MTARNLCRVQSGDIRLGEPLRHSIYDARGTLLLRKGVVVSIPSQIERLLADGVFADEAELAAAGTGRSARAEPPPVLKIPTFLRAEDFCQTLKSLVLQVLRVPEQANLVQKAGDLARNIQAACAENHAPLVAALHVDQDTNPLIIHQVFGAVLCELVARRLEIGEAERVPLICAALTRDFGQTVIQQELDAHHGPLTDALRAKLHQHPQRSVDLLRRAGVTDSSWLDAVQSHHERLDGSGYPAGLRGDQIAVGARLLAVCDIYSAMVKPRAHRPRGQANFTQLALREIFGDQGVKIDNALAAQLIKAIGVLPPGSIVRLKCGEIAIVKDTVSSLAGARVWSIYDQHQMPVLEPLPRDTSKPGHEIVGMAHYSECRSAQIVIRSLWLKEK